MKKVLFFIKNNTFFIIYYIFFIEILNFIIHIKMYHAKMYIIKNNSFYLKNRMILNRWYILVLKYQYFIKKERYISLFYFWKTSNFTVALYTSASFAIPPCNLRSIPWVFPFPALSSANNTSFSLVPVPIPGNVL